MTIKKLNQIIKEQNRTNEANLTRLESISSENKQLHIELAKFSTFKGQVKQLLLTLNDRLTLKAERFGVAKNIIEPKKRININTSSKDALLKRLLSYDNSVLRDSRLVGPFWRRTVSKLMLSVIKNSFAALLLLTKIRKRFKVTSR